MLVLSRKVGQTIHVGNDVVITVVRADRGKARIGIEAPPHMEISRGGKAELQICNSETEAKSS